MEKDRVLSILKPHMFFDDRRSHLMSAAGDLPMVHVPFGVANKALGNPDVQAESAEQAATGDKAGDVAPAHTVVTQGVSSS
ncbi:5'-nucleotidase [compost metagenome]